MDHDFVESAIRAFDKRKETFEKSSKNLEKNAAFWASAPGVLLGAQYKCQIAYHLVEASRGIDLMTFCETVVGHHERLIPDEIPRKTRGLNSATDDSKSYFTADTYYGWLKATGKTSPADPFVEKTVECVLYTADTYLQSGHLKPDKSIRAILNGFRGDVRAALNACVKQLYYVPGSIDFRYIPSRVHRVSSPGPQRSFRHKNAQTAFRGVCEALRNRRSVQVVGPHYSGKHSLLRRVVERYKDDGFETASGAKLSLCVLSLYEIHSINAVEYIADFYRSAFGMERIGESETDLLSEISHFSRQLPALIVIAGLEIVDSDEVVRALHQDLIGEVISRVLQGHPETRLLVSTSTEEVGNEYGKSPHPTLVFDKRVSVGDSKIEPLNYEYRSLLQCAIALAERRGKTADQAIGELGDLWRSDRALEIEAIRPSLRHRLAKRICESVLTNMQRSALALVALSNDGLKPSTLTAVVRALRGIPKLDCDWAFDPISVLASLPIEVVRDPCLGVSNLDTESCYQVERALRTTLLETWRRSAGKDFRAASWAMARAAASEARRLRVEGGIQASLGRDVQVLSALLGSVDVRNISSSGEFPSENVILPPLDEPALLMPSSRATIEFSYQKLLVEELLAGATIGIPIFSDARLQLAATRCFFDITAPWSTRITDEDVAESLSGDHVAPIDALPLAAKLNVLLFVTSAVSRLSFARSIRNCARLARNWADSEVLDDRSVELFGRIQRYELDFAILIGWSAESDSDSATGGSEETGPSLARVEALACRLMSDLTRRASERALHGKGVSVAVFESERCHYQARMGEILYLGGKHREAYWQFLEANGGPKSQSSPSSPCLLRGRSRRMFTRLVVEMARSKLYDPILCRPIRYRDGLELPMLQRVMPPPARLQHAERLIAESMRGLARGSTNDAIGVKIDRARLMALQLRYAEALKVLAFARPLIRDNSASRDIVLEYLSVVARTTTDAAAFAMAMAGMKQSEERRPYEPDLAELSSYLGLEPAGQNLDWRHAVAISNELCVRGENSLSILRSMVLLPDNQRTRYCIYADYLEVWLRVVRSRQTIDIENDDEVAFQVYEQLTEAGYKFEEVLEAMVSSGYLLQLRQAMHLREGLMSAGVIAKLPDGLGPDSRRPEPSDAEPAY